jgi:hypothetical protein
MSSGQKALGEYTGSILVQRESLLYRKSRLIKYPSHAAETSALALLNNFLRSLWTSYSKVASGIRLWLHFSLELQFPDLVKISQL